jgi:hypothetical protein
MKRNIVLAIGLIVVTAMMFSAPGCRKLKIEEATTDDVNIVGYLDKNLDSFSLFRQILDRTGNSAFLNAYGAIPFLHQRTVA